ncbi:aldo/keto reductase [Tersicoccus phoenicis]|uniref:Aldo/keto reductase n=1 Tax=Tersicoccus phoenicis TaxID=554083 RepID=A0A1R1L8W7_9MICC|nr:aldo/keto reductase [Tersicoccus phoenicis]OMH23976.1 aldo/keto reductase [Tersicoccus phoenicis]
MLEQRDFGATGLRVSAVGLGAGQIGEDDVTEEEAAAVLHGAIDAGVTLIDTAASYGSSEERIGRHLAGRRDEFVLSTKGGQAIDGNADWTPGAVLASIDRSLRRTRSERLDIFFLHSCPVDVLRRGDLQETLDDAVAAGKVGVAGYSGDNEHLAFAADSGRFGAIETSVNVVDQWNLRNVVGRVDRDRSAPGVIAKRPIANAPWRFAERPSGHYAELYWERFRELDLDPGELDWGELALRFTAYAPGVHTAIVGTAKPEHLRRNIEAAGRGPLPAETLTVLDQAWQRVGGNWPSST